MIARLVALVALALACCDTDMTPDQAQLVMALFMSMAIAGSIDHAASKVADAIRDLRDHKVTLDTRSQIDVRVRGDDGKPVRVQAVGGKPHA